ncbi:small integral membrane protein 22 [Suncus etruscus]|uniref:small integral membrane protein 22 n=1 Tax=Suncus etruscus TaxID=109475 RepID=UPI0021107562|nr:small integral membrane protein 22 [Suncus etruscus]
MGDLEATANDLLGRLKSKQLFQSSWDTAAFVIFFTFIGMVLLLLLLVLIHCCCCCCCHSPRYSRAKQKNRQGVDNLAMEP